MIQILSRRVQRNEKLENCTTFKYYIVSWNDRFFDS